jgi:hypothetical protein
MRHTPRGVDRREPGSLYQAGADRIAHARGDDEIGAVESLAKGTALFGVRWHGSTSSRCGAILRNLQAVMRQ